MTDNELIQLFRPILISGLITAGYPNVPVKQANQPTAQGVNTIPTLYFFKTGDHRFGWLRKEDRWLEDEEIMQHIEMQYYETTFQIMSLVRQNPQNITGPTASDLVNEAAAIMQSEQTGNLLREQDVGILRIIDIPNPYFVDDRDQFEASPSFEFTLIHKQTRISTVPVVNSIELDIKRV